MLQMHFPTTLSALFFSTILRSVCAGLCRWVLPLLLLLGPIAAHADNDDQILSVNVPTRMTAGEKYKVSVLVQNTGQSTWTAAGGYSLGAVGNRPTWTVMRAPVLADVGPNGSTTFDFEVTAPTTAGSYKFDWGMLQELVEWFGPTTGTPVTVDPVSYNAAFVSMSGVPTWGRMQPGQQATINITMTNTGNTTWSSSANYFLGSQNPENEATWGMNRVSLPGPVAPGASVSIPVTITAPTQAGDYHFQWRMLKEGVTWFGDRTQDTVIKVAAPTGNNVQILGVDVPTKMEPGGKYQVAVGVKNTGTTTWTSSAGYMLGTQAEVGIWGSNRQVLPTSLAPGQSATIAFNVTAPATPGTYNFDWAMRQDGVEWFGPTTGQFVNVIAPSYNAAFVGQTGVPAQMQPGASATVNVTMTNTGNTTWASTADFFLGSQNPENNTIWGLNRVSLPSQVGPGQRVTIPVTIKAPSTYGDYHFQWRMLKELVAWIGDYTPDTVVKVSPDGAAVLSVGLPSRMETGKQYQVSVSMQNTGTSTWSNSDGYGLVPAGDVMTWRVNRQPMPATVGPGQSTTFVFSVTAPPTPGTYNFDWGMIRDSVGRFGTTTAKPIPVDLAVSTTAKVSLTATPTNARVTGTTPLAVTFSGSASTSNGQLTRLDLLVDSDGTGYRSVPMNTVTGSTATLSMNYVASLAAGQYRFLLRASDANGVADSTPVLINVTNSPLLGIINGVRIDASNTPQLNGWVCQSGSVEHLAYTLYAGAPTAALGGKAVTSGTASVATDPENATVQSTCGTPGTSHHFNIDLTAAAAAMAGGIAEGTPLYVQAKTAAGTSIVLPCGDGNCNMPGSLRVALTSPLNNDQYAAPAAVFMRAKLANVQGTMDEVAFSINGEWIVGQPDNEPNTFFASKTNLGASTTPYSVIARVRQGNVTIYSSESLVYVAPSTGVTVNLLSPSATTTANAGSPINLSATVSAPSRVTSVKFYANGALVGTGINNGGTWSATWNNSVAGNYGILAAGFDGSGVQIAQSAILPLKVSSTGLNPAVLSAILELLLDDDSTEGSVAVSVALPGGGTSVNAGTAVTLTATSAGVTGTVAKVVFFANGQNIGIGTNNGGTWSLVWTPASSGNVQVTAIAYDASGAELAQSTTAVGFTVNGGAGVSVTVPQIDNADAGSLPGHMSVGKDGASVYSLPLPVPPGTAGMAPNLTLNYSSNGSNGMVGLGWSMSGLSTIHRCAKTLAQDGLPGRISFDTADRLCLDGRRLLRADGSNPGTDVAAVDAAYWAAGAQYRTEEETFVRVTRLNNGGFKVEAKDGRVHYYGTDANSAIAAQGRADGRPLLWALARTEDRSGNFMTFAYSADATTGEYLPTQIRYGGNSNKGQAADLAVRFEYEGRGDAQVQYLGGSRNDLRNRLIHVKTYLNTAADGSGGTLVRDHAISYINSATSGRSLVAWMQASAVNAVTGTTEYLPKTTFDWGAGSALAMTTLPIKPFYLPTPPTPTVRSNPLGATQVYASQYQADLDGSGLTSFFANRRYSCGLNGEICGVDADNILQIRLPGKAEFGRTLNLSAAGLPSTSSLRILTGDLDGDGRDDLVLIDQGQWNWAYCLNVPQADGTVDFTCHPGGAGEPTFIDMRRDRRVHLILPFDTSGNSTEYYYDQGEMQQRSVHMANISALAGMTGLQNKAFFQMGGIELSKNGMSDISIAWKDYVAPADPAHACAPTQVSISADPVGAAQCSGRDIHLGVASCFNAQSGLVCQSIYQTTFAGDIESNASSNDQRSNVTSSRSVGDLNGDGLTDFVYTLANVGGVRTKSYLCLSKESGVDCQPAPALTPASPYNDYFPGSGQVGDFVGDGLTRMFEVAGATQFCRNSINGLVCNDVTVPRGMGVSQPVFMDASGVPAFLLNSDSPDQTHTTYPQSPYSVISFFGAASQDKLVGVTNGVGQREEVDYARGDDTTVYRRFALIAGVEQRPVYPQVAQTPGVMVKQLRHSNGQGDWLREDYHYEGAFSDARGRGSLGFGLMRVTDKQTNIVTTTTFSQSFPYTGMVLHRQTVTSSDIALDDTTNTLGQKSMTQVSGVQTVFAFTARTKTVRKDLLAGEDLGTIVTDNTYGDNWGNLTQQTITSTGADKTFTNTTSASFSNDSSSWLLGLVGNVTVTKTDGAGGDITRTVGHTYLTGTTLLQTETVEPNDSTYQVVTTYDRTGNDFGLVNTTSQGWVDPATGDAVSRTVLSTTYDTKGRFPRTITNAVGHSRTLGYDAGTGAQTSLRDPNNLTTTWTNDAFGRVTKEFRADGNEVRSYRKQCNASCPPNATVATITDSYHGSDRIAVPQMSYTDSAGHVVREQTWGFDGRVIVVDRHYDSLGRLHQEDQPRFDRGTAYPALQTDYDDLNRVTALTTFDESNTQRTATTQYQGLVHKLTNAKNQTRIDTLDVLGRTVGVQDAMSGQTWFSYDGFGNLTQTIDPNTNRITVIYDRLGRKTDLKDPDLGWIEYKVDPVGRTWKQISPVQRKNAASWSKPYTTFSYDKLDRMTARFEPDLESHWTFDTASMGVGQLAEAYTQLASGVKDYSRVHSYDSQGRPATTTLTLYGGSYKSTLDYDLWGRVATQTYQRDTDAAKVFDLRYNEYGYLARIERDRLVLWKAAAQDAAARVTQAVLGNNLTQNRTYNLYSGRLEGAGLITGSNETLLTEGYNYDALGNVMQRSQYWDNAGFTESFTYDDLNRLNTSQVAGLAQQTFNFFADGSLRNKTGVGTGDYTYPPQGAAAVRPHAVQSVTGLSGSFGYDDDGNQTSAPGRGTTWTTFDMPLRSEKGTAYSRFAYGPEHQRTRQDRSDGTTVVYAGVQEVETNGAKVTVKTYWPQGVGVEIDRPGQATELDWTHTDRLGSIIGITDASGKLREKLAYDAWGKRRNLDGSSTADSIDGTTDNKGFTGHEMLDLLDLVHMNGRVYDPFTVKFLSGDPLVQDPVNGQNYNRYSYVLNNPTNLTDPTGFTAIGAEGANDEREKSDRHETRLDDREKNCDSGGAWCKTTWYTYPTAGNGGESGKASSRTKSANSGMSSSETGGELKKIDSVFGNANDGTPVEQITATYSRYSRVYATPSQLMTDWVNFDPFYSSLRWAGASEGAASAGGFALSMVGNPRKLVVDLGKGGVTAAAEHSKEFSGALSKAVEWLDARGFKAEQETLGKFGSNAGKPIGMQTSDGKIGFRVEFDERNGAHINVWAGKEKGPHFTFDASQRTVDRIVRLFQ